MECWNERSRSWCFKFSYVIKVRAVVFCYLCVFCCVLLPHVWGKSCQCQAIFRTNDGLDQLVTGSCGTGMLVFQHRGVNIKMLTQKGECILTLNHYAPPVQRQEICLGWLMNMGRTNNPIWIMTQRPKSKSQSQRSQAIGELQPCHMLQERSVAVWTSLLHTFI